MPPEYEALDLSGHFNAGRDIFQSPETLRLGQRLLHGLPFRFGDAGPGPCVLLLTGDTSVELSLPPDTRWLVFAHAILEKTFFESGDVGTSVARYDLVHQDGSVTSCDIRQRMEIGPSPKDRPGRPIPLDWGQTPFLAVPEAEQVLMHRTRGRYDAAGARLVEIDDPQSRTPYLLPYRFFLFPLRNPRPDLPLAALRLVSLGPPIILGAITVSRLAEDPLTRTVAEDILIELDRPVTERLSIEIDRGTATYLHPAIPARDTPVAGWGAAEEPVRSGWARVSGTPSATIRIRDDDTPVATCRFGDLLARGDATDGPVTFRVLNRDRTWVRIRVTDSRTGALRPCRLHLRTPEGIPCPPYGHHAPVGGGGGTWNLDIGGDVRLGVHSHATIDGTCEGWLPVGPVIVEAACGFEYRPVRRTVIIAPGQADLHLSLEPLSAPGPVPMVAGDTHLHFMSSQGALHEARAEGVSVANLLLSQWGQHFSSTEEFTGVPLLHPDGETVVFAGQENRSNMLGHIHLLGMSRPIMPWCTGGAEEAALGGGLETTLSHWADECQAAGGTVIAAHFPVPDGEIAALIATGRIDAVEMIACEPRYLEAWYRYLNAGYRLPIVGGTDKMTSDVAVGQIRTYAESRAKGDYQGWLDAIRRGRCYATSGPLLDLAVDGARSGDLHEAAPGDRLCLRAEALSIFPLERLDLLVDGEVVATRSATGSEQLTLEAEWTVDRPIWVAARVFAGPEMRLHHDIWNRPIMAHSSPVYVGTSAGTYRKTDVRTLRHMRRLCEAIRLHLSHRAVTAWPGAARQRHGQADHLAYLLQPIDEALAAIDARLRDPDTFCPDNDPEITS